MKIQVHEIGIPWWPWNYRYRVTAIGSPKVDTPALGYDNNLFDLRDRSVWLSSYDYLRLDIRNWLLNSLNYMDWTTEHPREFGEECGILFRHRRDVMMFKLVWG